MIGNGAPRRDRSQTENDHWGASSHADLVARELAQRARLRAAKDKLSGLAASLVSAMRGHRPDEVWRLRREMIEARRLLVVAMVSDWMYP
jgi:hypothetical protein